MGTFTLALFWSASTDILVWSSVKTQLHSGYTQSLGCLKTGSPILLASEQCEQTDSPANQRSDGEHSAFWVEKLLVLGLKTKVKADKLHKFGVAQFFFFFVVNKSAEGDGFLFSVLANR